MRRQRCVLGALAQQTDPATLAAHFPAIARAAQQNIRTDIALDDLDAWVELAQRVRGASVTSLPFTPDVIDTANPDFAKVHALVRRALAQTSSPQPAALGGKPARSSATGAKAPRPTSARSADASRGQKGLCADLLPALVRAAAPAVGSVGRNCGGLRTCVACSQA